VERSVVPIDVRARVAAAIQQYGYALQCVGTGCSVPGCACAPSPRPWAYTIGLTELARPELIVFGLSDRLAAALVAHVVDEWDEWGSMPAGRDADLDFVGVPYRLVPVPPRSVQPRRDLIAGWYAYSGGVDARADVLQPDVLQVVWADERDRFPWHTDFDVRFRVRQPVLEMQPNAMLVEPTMTWPVRSAARRASGRRKDRPRRR
jgi:hypothetical protein